jgi:hypothetical protein
MVLNARSHLSLSLIKTPQFQAKNTRHKKRSPQSNVSSTKIWFSLALIKHDKTGKHGIQAQGQPKARLQDNRGIKTGV